MVETSGDLLSVSYTVENLDEIPESPSQYAEFTLTPQIQRRNRRKRRTHRADVSIQYDVERRGSSLQVIKHLSSDSRNASVNTTTRITPSRDESHNSVANGATLFKLSLNASGTGYDITNSSCHRKYSQFTRMSVIRHFTR